MTPIEVAPADQALEGIMLEELWREELGCEASHAHSLNPDCSVIATHRFFGCTPTSFVCARSAQYVEWVLADDRAVCAECSESCVAHWRVVPI